jgi:hypothetical protein
LKDLITIKNDNVLQGSKKKRKDAKDITTCKRKKKEKFKHKNKMNNSKTKLLQNAKD